MSKRVVYIDPLWAIGADGTIAPESATVERNVFGNAVDITFGVLENGNYVREGPRAEELVRGADALVISRAQITPVLVAAMMPSCKVVGRSGVGFDNLNVPLLRERGIFGFNVPDYCVDEVSTHALALMLALERKVGVLDERVKAGTWNSYDGIAPRRMSTLTLGIVGFGNIGRATAQKAQAFFKRVVAFDPYVHADFMAGYGVDKCDALTDLAQISDVIAIHCVLSEQTRKLINAQALAPLRSGTVLVNTARGDIVDPQAVLDALDDGRLGGYGSDVFTPENPLDHPVNAQIVKRANVLVTPHSAFRSDEAEISQRRRVAEGVLHVLRSGEPPPFGRQA
jgi:phosphoglycerate dehydrogenase-like enzyme